MNKEKQMRIQWVDVARGMAIMLVVLGHCIGTTDDPGNKWILAFHMPAFFFISGLFAKNMRGAKGNSLTAILHRARSIIIPMITYAVISGISGFFDIAFDVLRSHNELVLSSIARQLIGSLFSWFLLVMLWTSIAFIILSIIVDIDKRLVRIITLLVCAALAIAAAYSGVYTIIRLETVPTAFLFYFSGYIMRDRLMREKADNKGLLYSSLWIIAIPVSVILSCLNTPIKMYLNDYGNYFIFLPAAAVGIFVLINTAKRLGNDKLFEWLGKNSIIIYVVHFSVVKTVHAVEAKILGWDLNNYFSYWLCFLVSLAVLLPIVYVCERWLYMLFGKKPLHKSKD